VLKRAVVSADTGYFSNRNLEAFAAAKVDAYVPDPKFRQRDPRFAQARRYRRPTDRHKQQYKSKRRWFGPQDFKYDAASERLICPAGMKLHRSGHEMKTAQGYLISAYRAAKSACLRCPLREQCLRNPQSGHPRQVRVFHGRLTGTLTSRMKEKIDTPEGRIIYSRRLGDSRAGLRQHRCAKRHEPLHAARHPQGQYPVEALLHGPQSRDDRALWSFEQLNAPAGGPAPRKYTVIAGI
jgi:hypothetical protein